MSWQAFFLSVVVPMLVGGFLGAIVPRMSAIQVFILLMIAGFSWSTLLVYWGVQ